jgi:hypothetical protein
MGCHADSHIKLLLSVLLVTLSIISSALLGGGCTLGRSLILTSAQIGKRRSVENLGRLLIWIFFQILLLLLLLLLDLSFFLSFLLVRLSLLFGLGHDVLVDGLLLGFDFLAVIGGGLDFGSTCLILIISWAT